MSRAQNRFQNRELPFETRLNAVQIYRKHLMDQFSDRCAFYSLRDISTDVMARTITCCTDGADQVHQQEAINRLVVYVDAMCFA